MLTAAHCFQHPAFKPDRVRLGVHDRTAQEAGMQESEITFTLHPGYNK